MKFSRIIVICFILALSLTLTEPRADHEASISFERLSDRILIVKAGNVASIAIASERGLVLIDTGTPPSLTAECRKIIEREFGRNDFAYVINTHFHSDHTRGNQVFPKAEIIAHELTPNLMRQSDEKRQNFVAYLKNWINALNSLEPNSEDAQQLRDTIATNTIMIDDLENNYVLTLPTITFSDRMTLDLGDLRLKLIYFGEGLHTGDDIIIHCPEEKLLFTGDLFSSGSMRVASPVASSALLDTPRWIEVLNEVLKDMNQVEWVYSAHTRRMPGKFIALWQDYLVDLWQGLNAAKEEGLNFEAVQERFSYDKKFAYLEQSGLEEEQLRRDHQQNLTYVWRRILEMQSAATVLEEVISESGIEAALKKYKEMYSNREEKYYFDEEEFNGLGYRLLQGNRIFEAIEIFKLNVKMYPDSSNVYDSLGEAYLNAGETELAIKNYQKSLEINPQNTNAINILKRIKKEN